MNRQEFLFQLAEGLIGLPPEERISALKYYEEYFEDAGNENEEQVLEELGTPQEVARTILKDYAGREAGDTAYYDTAGRSGSSNPPPPPVYTPAAPASDRSVWTKVLVVVLLLFFGWPILIAVFGLLMGVMGGILGLGIALIAAFVGLLVGGVAMVVRGIIGIVVAPAAGLLELGLGLLFTGIGLLILLGGVLLTFKALPKFIRWVVSLFRRLFRIDKGGDTI